MNNHPSITDAILVAYIDGEAEPKEHAYIEANRDEFAERLSALTTAENELRENLAAFRPISSFDLGQYQLGYGSEAERARIAAYLDQHPHAKKSLDMLDQFIDALDPGPIVTERTGLFKQARILLGKLVGSDTPQGALALGLRGAQEGVYAAGEFQVVVESDTDFDDASKLALSGLLTGIDDASGLTAYLWHSGHVTRVAAVELDEFGNFGFSRLDTGRYELIISSDNADFEIHIQDITVEALD